MAEHRFYLPHPEDASIEVLLQNRAGLQKGIHFHPEFQLAFVLEGRGTLHIANHTQSVSKGDVFLIGAEVPHALLSSETPKERGMRMLSIYFLPDALGEKFFKIPEMLEIKHLLGESAGGIWWAKGMNPKIQKQVFQLVDVRRSPMRIILFLNILTKISHIKHRETIAATQLVSTLIPEDNTLTKILQYICKNFDQPISLEDMAQLVSLNKYSFCRYFKRMTDRSFIAYLNEFRISKACRFLNSETYNISQIGYLVGYNTLSNFYHQFQKIMKCTPTEYREAGDMRLMEG